MLVPTMGVSVLCYLIKIKSAKVLRCQGVGINNGCVCIMLFDQDKKCQGVEVLRCQGVGVNNGCVCIMLFDQDKRCQGVEVLRCQGVGINNGCVCVSKVCQLIKVLFLPYHSCDVVFCN